MKIENNKIQEIKEANAGKKLYAAWIKFTDSNGESKELEFIHCKPTIAVAEEHFHDSQKSPIRANLNVMANVMVYPEPKEIIDQVKDLPGVFNTFVNEKISPFFGAVEEMESSPL